MADKAREWTDKKLAKMEREISLMYKKSAKDLYKKWDAYIGRGNKRIQTLEKDLRDALKVGDEQVIAGVEKRLQKAKEAFTYKNEHYKQMLNSVTLDMAQVNNDVRAYINGQLPEIYAKNYTQANEIVKGMNLNFALPNENAIKARILEGDVKTPFMRSDNKNFVKIPKDQRWNTKFINSQVIQGIIQGEDMRTISKRIFPEMWAKADKEGLTEKEKKGLLEKNKQSAIRNARTLVTGAENQGKHDSYKDLSKRGLVLKQVWIATGDARTRDWHLVMDGQERDIDEKFKDGIGNELRYPADPQADASTVYNCRCALTSKVVGFRNADGTIRRIEEEEEGQDLHDRQIAKEKERRIEEAERKEQTKAEKEEQPQKEVLHGDKDSYDRLETIAQNSNIQHNEVKELEKALTDDEIIDRIAGGDMTGGSCSSLALAYCANKNGLDVHDFRGGKSREMFARNINIPHAYKIANADVQEFIVKKEASEVAKIIKGIEEGREYILRTGKHASVIRKINGKMEYLELQSSGFNGWNRMEYSTIFGERTVEQTLKERFSCRKTVDRDRWDGTIYKKSCLLIPVDSVQPTEEFKKIMGYINTGINNQKKGFSGSVK